MSASSVIVDYREATVGDVAAMALSRLSDPVAGPADERMGAYLERQHHPQQALTSRVAYVAYAAGVVVGYIAGHLTARYGCDGEVQYLFVTPQHRGTGVAAQLLRLQARWFTQQGARRICVNVAPDNARARAFYARHGAAELNRFWMVWGEIQAVEAGAG